jgi:hypothetical protein
MMDGFVERLKQELSPNDEISINVKAPENRNYLSFIGGKKMASSTQINAL